MIYVRIKNTSALRNVFLYIYKKYILVSHKKRKKHPLLSLSTSPGSHLIVFYSITQHLILLAYIHPYYVLRIQAIQPVVGGYYPLIH